MTKTTGGSLEPHNSETERRSLRYVIRPAPTLAPEDSFGRALILMRQLASDRLPILRHGHVVGEVHEADIADQVNGRLGAEAATALRRSVSELLRPLSLALRPAMSHDEARRLCAAQDVTLLRCVPVIDADDYCLGVVHIHDLIAGDPPAPRPSPIGGMATPFGVYLTDGSLQAGAGNLALVASGAAMGLTFVVATLLVNGALRLAQHYVSIPDIGSFDIDPFAGTHDLRTTMLSVGGQLAVYFTFLTTMRATMLAGYHAAEHQTVHAIERFEPLTPEVVARMPRAHPRCGTNLMAAVTLFLLLQCLYRALPGFDWSSAELAAGLTTLFTWRPVGAFLQERFTTRKANPTQLQSGIAAGAELMAKYLNSPPVRPRLWRRIWCMGMLQSLAGMMLVTGIAFWLLDIWNSTHR
jgi:CBS domain-containing protein